MEAAITRRRALLLGAAAGLGALARGWPDPGSPWAAEPTSFGMDVPAGALARGRLSAPLRAPRRFDLLGLRGTGVPAAGVEVRVRRRGGSWSPWVPVGPGGAHAPDHPPAAPASDPVWTGGADELQLRARRPLGALRVHFVRVAGGARRAARARRAQAPADGTPAIIPRAQWGGDQVKPRADPSYGTVQMAFVHHTVNTNDYAPEDSPGIVLAIAKYHRDTNGWNDIGYNFLVDKYGQVFEGRAGGIDQPVIGAHAQGWNSKSTGVATIGTFMDVPFPDAGLQALSHVIGWKLSLHGVPSTGQVTLESGGGSQNRYGAGMPVAFERISGHRDGCSTDCPGNALFGQLGEIRGRAAAVAGIVGSTPRLTLEPAARSVGYGDDAVVGGRLAQADGTPVIGAAIDVQKHSSAGFVTVARTTTGDDGGWSARVPWRRGGVVRARSRMGDGTTLVTSPQVNIALVPLLRLLAPRARSRVVAGHALTLRGSIRPASAVKVLVERQDPGGRWRGVRDVGVPVSGTAFRTAVRLPKPGLYRVTVRTTGGAVGPVYVRAVRSPRSIPGSGTNGGAGRIGPPGSGNGGVGAG